MSPCHGEDQGFDPPIVRQRCRCSSVVEHQPSKLIMRVRFPSSAPERIKPRLHRGFIIIWVAILVAKLFKSIFLPFEVFHL
jgi:hypothetical protein